MQETKSTELSEKQEQLDCRYLRMAIVWSENSIANVVR